MWIVIKEIDNKQHYRLNKRNAAEHSNNRKLKMKNKLIDELEKTIEFLHQTGWHKQAVWYENKLKLIKESEEGCASFYQNLHEVDASLKIGRAHV